MQQKSYLLIEELTGFLLNRVEILDLASGETYDECHALRCGRVLVKVVTCRLSPLIDSLVYGFAEIHGLERGEQRPVSKT